MGDIPSMWRVELLHPLVVHFPIALLLVGAAVRLGASAVGRGERWSFLKPAGRLLLVIGVPLAWLGVYTGLLANAEVARSLCDPTVKRVHEDLAYATAATFSGALVADLGTPFLGARGRLRTLAGILAAGALVAGSGLLLYTGHLGSRLVYQQAAAVYRPSAECTEFE